MNALLASYFLFIGKVYSGHPLVCVYKQLAVGVEVLSVDCDVGRDRTMDDNGADAAGNVPL